MARLGGLFHVFRTIPKVFKKKRCFDNALHEFHRRLPSLAKNSTAQNWHKAAQNLVTRTRSVRTEKRAPRQPPGQVIFNGYFLGLSQAIPRVQSVPWRQWILIPPCGGSNPPAPAKNKRGKTTD
jgi:hypothetical protein